jgi:hypothetical protein
MSKGIQMTTTGGTAGLVYSIQSLFSLFGQYKVPEFGEALSKIPIADLGTAIIMLCVSAYLVHHDEDKVKT